MSVRGFSHTYTDQSLAMIYYFLQSVVKASILGCCSVPGLHRISCFQHRHLVTKGIKEPWWFYSCSTVDGNNVITLKILYVTKENI